MSKARTCSKRALSPLEDEPMARASWATAELFFFVDFEDKRGAAAAAAELDVSVDLFESLGLRFIHLFKPAVFWARYVCNEIDNNNGLYLMKTFLKRHTHSKTTQEKKPRAVCFLQAGNDVGL